jgi:beta,beta-carotene 9',10'-dioxygenase
LVKVDMETGEKLYWSRPDHWPSEPLFVPRPGATQEDDGVVLCTILGGKEYATSYLLILDAKTMEPLAEAKGPIRVPFMSHGNWYGN